MTDGKIALVIDGDGAIGRFVAESLAHAGQAVYASMHDLSGVNTRLVHNFIELALTFNLDLHVLKLDASSDESCRNALSQIVAERGRLDIVVDFASQGQLVREASDERLIKLAEEIRAIVSYENPERPISILIDAEQLSATVSSAVHPYVKDAVQAYRAGRLTDLQRNGRTSSVGSNLRDAGTSKAQRHTRRRIEPSR
jgi:NAD(P)-dependent dehydrogenase (short-subunit alcohol dehydrogenase family)